MRKFKVVLGLILVFLAFLGTGYKFIDPDLGWHLRMGEVISKTGIPATDPFSYSMPSYPFVDYEWLTNLVWYKTWPFLGVFGWNVFYSLMAIVTVWIAIPTKLRKYVWIPMLLGWSSMLFRFGVRPQVINWFFWAILVRCFFDDGFWKKFRWFFPMLMLFWGNLHGSYPLGIVSVALWIGFRFVQTRKLDKADVISWGIGTLITIFANPYGWRNWAEVILVMKQSALLRASINEWAPFYTMVDFGLIAGLVFVVMDGILFRNKWKWWQYVMAAWMVWWGVSGLRYAPLFMVFAAPVIAGLMKSMKEKAEKVPEGLYRFGVFNRVLLAVGMIIFFVSSFITVKRGIEFSEDKFYPRKAISFLKEKGYVKNLFSEYGWGGYLLWKMPGDRYFIDGRMSCFEWGKKAPPGESDHALKEYQKMLNDRQKLKEGIEKYKIKTLLWPKDSYYGGLSMEMQIDKWIREFLGLPEYERVFKSERFFSWFEEMGWKRIYEDEVAVIYTKSGQ